MPNGFCDSGIVGTSKTRPRSRARFGRARTWRKQPQKVSLTSSKRYSRVLARFVGTWGTCCAAGAMVGTRTGGLWVVLMDLLTSQETASCACDDDRGCPTYRSIESDSLPRALDDPGGGFERRVALLSASDEADAKNFIGESSRFVSPQRRSSIDDRRDASVRERSPREPRTPVTTARSIEQRECHLNKLPHRGDFIVGRKKRHPLLCPFFGFNHHWELHFQLWRASRRSVLRGPCTSARSWGRSPGRRRSL